MSQKIASLYAEIGANTAPFEKGAKNVKTQLGEMGKSTNTFAGSLKAAATNAAVITAAVSIATQSYDKLITQTQKYNQEVLDMMISTGGTAEETSRLIQVVYDAGVSYDTLKNAMKLAIKNGVEPNIEGIAALADEYNSLKDPIAQGQLLMDKFGKSGLEMGRVMVLGGDDHALEPGRFEGLHPLPTIERGRIEDLRVFLPLTPFFVRERVGAKVDESVSLHLVPSQYANSINDFSIAQYLAQFDIALP